MAAAGTGEGEIDRITKGIENAVKQHFAESDADSLTVNGIRSRAEADLSLDNGFLRTDPFWRDRSKIIIRDEFERQNDVEVAKNSPTPAPPKKVPNKKKKAAPSKRTQQRPQPSDKAPQARERKASSPVHGNDTEPPSSKKRQRATKIVVTKEKIGEDSVSQHKSPESGAGVAEIVDKSAPAIVDNIIDTEPERITKDGSDSEMSEVLDTTPVKKKQRTAVPPTNRKSSAKATSTKTTVKSRSKKSKENAPVDADTEKIRELQGWLGKCGVRKVWGKELAKFSTTQERINHLRGMLAEIGMTGRYSNEKAKRIKEERELAADLVAVQEGDKAWGAESSEQMKTRSSRTVEAPPKTRKLIRPPELAFLDDQSEDSD